VRVVFYWVKLLYVQAECLFESFWEIAFYYIYGFVISEELYEDILFKESSFSGPVLEDHNT